MANEVPGMRVPEVLIERMRQSERPNGGPAEGIAIAREMAAALRPMIQGLLVSTSSGNADAALAVLDGLR